MPYKLILASGSPRRRELLAGLDLAFDVRLIDGIRETYPEGLTPEETVRHISREKADAYRPTMKADELIITADTIVVLDQDIMGKPASEADACRMLRRLAGRTHEVITACTLLTREKTTTFAATTRVTFAPLSEAEILHYVRHYRPFDKAGAYGIQEWIGHIGVTRIEGSYFNVMGLPVQRLYQELKPYI